MLILPHIVPTSHSAWWIVSLWVVIFCRVCVCVLVAQSHLTLCYPIDCRQPAPLSMERIAVPFSRGSSWPRGWVPVSGIAGRFLPVWATVHLRLWKYPFRVVCICFYWLIRIHWSGAILSITLLHCYSYRPFGFNTHMWCRKDVSFFFTEGFFFLPRILGMDLLPFCFCRGW